MKRIMVVDDMAVFREPIAATLRSRGFETLCAASGDEAVEMLRRDRADLVLLDISMPGVSGLEVLRQLRADERTRSLPVIVLTAMMEKENVIQAGALGVRDFLLKSQFSLDEMLERIGHRLEARDRDQRDSAAGGATAAGAAAPKAATDAPPPEPDSGHAPSNDAEAKTAQDAAIEPDGRPEAQPSIAPAGPPPAQADGIRALKPIVVRSEITELLDGCGELKALSPTVAQILKLTNSQHCSIEQVARAIKQDQAIALKVLKLANSSVYTRGEPVESVQKAVMRIGLAQIRQTVLNISVVDTFAADGSAQTLGFWEHSIACGLIAAELAHARGCKDDEADAAFTMGLLHDVGRLVYRDLLGERYERVVEAAERMQLPLEQVESRMLLVNHADAMDRVLHRWRFPKHLINPIAFHHLSMANIGSMARNMVPEVATLGLANRLAHALLLGSSGNRVIYPVDDFVTALKLEERVFEVIEREVPEQTSDIKFTLISGASPETWPKPSADVRDSLAGPLWPIFIGSDPGRDAYRMFLDRLREADGEAGPNVAVVRFTSVNERAALTEALLAAEAQAEAEPLPVVLISPKGSIGLEDGAMSGRRVERLATPTPVSRFIAACNSLLR